MTIAIFKLYANKIGGTEKAVQSLVSILNQNRYANECYAAVDVKEVQNSDDKCITLYNCESFLKKNKLKFYINYYLFLFHNIQKKQLVISTDIATSSLLMLANLMRFTRLNIICWEHYPFEKNSRIWQKIFKCLIFLNKKSVIVCNSTEEKKKFSFHNKIEVIPNSIKRTLYNQLYIEKEKLDLIYIGRIVKDKGVERLIDAIISFPGDKKHTLHIVGGGDELEYLKKKYAQIKEIIFYGPIINIEKFLEKNDVFVSGSYFECFPVTILEAMSHGLPIISMDTSGGTRSVISDSGGGYVCENKIEFHEKLSIFENSTVRAEHGKAGRSYVNKNYSDSIIGSKWIRLIENELTMKSE